ncbi:hypothetical protein BN1080_00389 [Planococcus massiliensis]|uniref:Core-binding (CB) domain-containing protein n=1 Tax=Planococcus massiliensis TaxID=1499687 RepID=A0A098EGT5_9BACL|nr:hypothetical protein [Planococcus massiliensis]CEG21478.1 hypothetical protein BN1080_00389 [Planococcus massiliensis]
MRKEEFINWMEEATSLGPSTIRSYAGAINTVSKGLKKYNHLSGTLYNLNNPTEFETLTIKYFSIQEFIDKDSRGNKMYSNALKYYKRFLVDKEKSR